MHSGIVMHVVTMSCIGIWISAGRWRFIGTVAGVVVVVAVRGGAGRVVGAGVAKSSMALTGGPHCWVPLVSSTFAEL